MIVQVLDFAAARDGTPASELGRRIFVDENGREVITPVARPNTIRQRMTAVAPVVGPANLPAPAPVVPHELTNELLAAVNNMANEEALNMLDGHPTAATDLFVQQVQMAAAAAGVPTAGTNTNSNAHNVTVANADTSPHGTPNTNYDH